MLLTLSNDLPEGSSSRHASRFQEENVLERLRQLDVRVRREGLGGLDPSSDNLVRIGMETDAQGRVTKNSYGVLNLSWRASLHPEWPVQVAAEVEHLRERIRMQHGVPLRYLIWAGMGGSAEDKATYQALGLLRRGPRLYVLDSTDPAKLKGILADIERRSGLSLPKILKSTLVVGMAMGMTSYEPVVNLEKLWNLYECFHIDSRPNFLYMTLPGSLLDQFAGPRGYRKVELQLDSANTTAGRHSAPLTRGSLYPLALAGVDLRAWMDATLLTDQEIQTAWQLAGFIQAQAEAGRDKVTLLLPKGWTGAGIWTKQDFEESLGKSESLGVKIVLPGRLRLADLRPARDPFQDRIFWQVQIKGQPAPEAQRVAMLRRNGYPVATLSLARGTQLSKYLQFVHYAVFALGYLRGMNFVTQPSVELYKTLTNCLFEESRKVGGTARTPAWKSMLETPCQARFRDCLTLRYERLGWEVAGQDAPQVYANILRRLAERREIEYGELTLFGDTRYSRSGAAARRALGRAADNLFGAVLKMPADVYEGPAMNHSFHEMIIGHGKCFSTVLLSEKQETCPQASYTPDYHLAQFLATQRALEERGRPVVSILLQDLEPESVQVLDEFFRRVISLLKASRLRSC